MRFRVVHRTRYAYGSPVVLCHNETRLTPRDTSWQSCTESAVEIEPAPARVSARVDFFGNSVLYFAVEEPHDELVVTATSEVELSEPPGHLAADPPWESVRELLRAAVDPESRLAVAFALDSPLACRGTEAAEFAAASFAAGRPALEAVRDLSARIHREFEFDPECTTIATPLAEVLERRRGVCQDFAHLAIACVRSMGLAARYVSGYLETIAPPGKPRLKGADVSHAWLSVFVPGAGWFDVDPTNDQVPTDRHVTTAWGRDYADVTPLKGVIFGGGAHTLEVAVDMERVEPRPSAPSIQSS
jgi:transglutaminase-like putative cysteine protease